MMSTKRGVRKCIWPAAPPASTREPLPVDLLLEIVLRSDATSIVRCARASKFFRGAILDPVFRRRLALQAPADGGSFHPALLFGVSYLTLSSGAQLNREHHIIDTPSSIKLHAGLQACSLRDSFKPVASRGHLLLLRRYAAFSDPPPSAELRVCDTTTGHVTSLPDGAELYVYAHSFLSVSDANAGGSYELIVTDYGFRFQTFSSGHGKWDAARQASVTGHPRYCDSSARVIGRTVYWLCRLPKDGGHFSDGIVGLDVDAAEARTIELSPCFSSMTMDLLLASVRGRLSLLVAKSGAISMWTLTSLQPAATWSRQLVIGAKEITRSVGLASSPLSYVLEGFGERSGAVIIRVAGSRDLLRLDLGTRVVSRLYHQGLVHVVSPLFLHETDLTSLLKKSF